MEKSWRQPKCKLHSNSVVRASLFEMSWLSQPQKKTALAYSASSAASMGISSKVIRGDAAWGLRGRIGLIVAGSPQTITAAVSLLLACWVCCWTRNVKRWSRMMRWRWCLFVLKDLVTPTRFAHNFLPRQMPWMTWIRDVVRRRVWNDACVLAPQSLKTCVIVPTDRVDAHRLCAGLKPVKLAALAAQPAERAIPGWPVLHKLTKALNRRDNPRMHGPNRRARERVHQHVADVPRPPPNPGQLLGEIRFENALNDKCCHDDGNTNCDCQPTVSNNAAHCATQMLQRFHLYGIGNGNVRENTFCKKLRCHTCALASVN